MKKLIYIVRSILILMLFSCNAQNTVNNNSTIFSIIESYVDYKNNERRIDNKSNILIVGSNKIEKQNNYDISIYFMNTELLSNFKYTEIYNLRGYKMVIDESLDNSIILKNAFENLQRLPYENFNLAKFPFSYNTSNWYITLNDKNEIVEILPQEKSKEIINILEKKGVKFSKDYIQ